MKITPLDIQQQQFRVRLRGFDVEEVDAFLEKIAEGFEALRTDNERQQADLERIRAECQGYREREEAFKRAILNSQKVIDQMKANARKSAELCIAEAELKAEQIVAGAQHRLTRLQSEIEDLKRQRTQIELQIRAVIEAHARLLDAGQEQAHASDEADGKIKVLKKPQENV